MPSRASSGKKAGKTITSAVLGLDEDEDDMEDLASEFGGMAVSSMNRVQALEDVRIQGVSLPRILVLSASLELGSVVATGEVAGGLLHYGGNPAMMEKARQSRKGGVDTLSKIITDKNRIALSSHFSALSREYTAKGWVEEVALISAFWTETMAHFDGNSKAMFGYLKEYFREFKGRGLPLAFSMPTAWRVLGQEGFAKAGLSDEQACAKMLATKGKENPRAQRAVAYHLAKARVTIDLELVGGERIGEVIGAKHGVLANDVCIQSLIDPTAAPSWAEELGETVEIHLEDTKTEQCYITFVGETKVSHMTPERRTFASSGRCRARRSTASRSSVSTQSGPTTGWFGSASST